MKEFVQTKSPDLEINSRHVNRDAFIPLYIIKSMSVYHAIKQIQEHLPFNYNCE